LYQPTSYKKTLLVAAVGQEHKLGRWLRIKPARNSMKVVELPSKTKGAQEASEDENGDE
jgi:ribosomal RNA-processing protein 9